MATFRDGQTNILGLNNPGVGIDVILPTPFINGASSNIEAIVGVGSWGKVDAVEVFDGSSCPYGAAQVRDHDIATHVAAAVSAGKQIQFRGVRVTDGTDTAAIGTVPSLGGQFIANCTGTLGNKITASFQNTAAIGAYAALVSFPGSLPERFDNIYQGLHALNVTAGTGYTSVPSLSISQPQIAGGVRATARASLVAVQASVQTGGTGHAVNDLVTLGNGVVVKVTAVNAGAITTATLSSAGSITSGGVPSTVGNQTSSTGNGTGAVFSLVWGLGPATFTCGSGYYAPTGDAITVTLSGGGAGAGGSYVAVASFWAALETAINAGTTQRAKSSVVVFSRGTSTAPPTLNVSIPFTGGTDGDAGVSTARLVGSDLKPRSGMYALRGSGMDCFALADCTDSTIWPAMLELAIEEAALAVAAMASGTSIEDAVAERALRGVDDPWIWILTGDWPTFYDSANGLRLVSPTAVALGLCGNLTPQLSPINNALVGVVATETSETGNLTADADESVAQVGGVDVIGRSAALGQTFFSFLTGRNASSNTAANGVEYTRLTNWITRSLQSSATRVIVGKLQSTTRADDPTRKRAKSILDGFFGDMKSESTGADGYGMIEDAAVICDLSINTEGTIVKGYLFALATVKYLNTVRYFVIRLAGGGNVQIKSASSAAQVSSVINEMAAA